jgi:hypothetical protein
MENYMGISPIALYEAVLSDVQEVTPFGPLDLGSLPPDASYRQVASSVLLSTITKKWLPDDTTLPDNEAKLKFFTSNNTCKDWSLRLDFSSDQELYGEFLRELDLFFHPDGNLLVSSLTDLLDHARCGPGASLGSDHHSTYAKMFSSKMATTSFDLYSTYRNYIEGDENMREAESNRRASFGYPKIVNSSRCNFVPKTRLVSRMVCVEPSLNMFYQLGLGTLLESRLRSQFGIDLRTQPDNNRRLAQDGSMTGRFSTIDLSSASDSISMALCKEIFPAWLYDLLSLLRVRYTDIDGVPVELHMMSTMGNGFTFPLQTIIFSCIIRASYRLNNIPFKRNGVLNWACFGDDLICETSSFRSVARLLSILGFTMNSSKTFFEGPCRESCGADWFNGQPVRGVYIKRLRSPQDYCVAINLLNDWSAYTGITLCNTIGLLSSKLGVKLYVPYDENPDSGIRVPFSFLSREMFKRDRNHSVLYRVFRSRTCSYSFDENGVIHYPGHVKKKNLIYNPSGLLLSFLRGEVVSGSISSRHTLVRYRVKLRCTPFWDYKPKDRLTNGYNLSWRQWETAVMLNLNS